MQSTDPSLEGKVCFRIWILAPYSYIKGEHIGRLQEHIGKDAIIYKKTAVLDARTMSGVDQGLIYVFAKPELFPKQDNAATNELSKIIGLTVSEITSDPITDHVLRKNVNDFDPYEKSEDPSFREMRAKTGRGIFHYIQSAAIWLTGN
jgi:hypothetical protein